METDPKAKDRPNTAPAAQPPPLLASQISKTTLTIVQSLEELPESAQRRIIEGVRVALGLSSQNPSQRQQQPPQRRGNGQ